RLVLVTKCSRLLRFGSRPSVKLLKAVIGICPPNVSASVATRSARKCPSGSDLLFLGRRSRKIGIPDISATLPLSVRLLFPNIEIFAAVVDRLAVRIVHIQFIGATYEANVARFRHFH